MNLYRLLGVTWISHLCVTITRAATAATATLLLTTFALIATLIAARAVFIAIIIATIAVTTTPATIVATPVAIVATRVLLPTAVLAAIKVAVDLITVFVIIDLGAWATHVVQDTLVMVRELIIIFSQNTVTGLLGLPCLVFVFF